MIVAVLSGEYVAGMSYIRDSLRWDNSTRILDSDSVEANEIRGARADSTVHARMECICKSWGYGLKETAPNITGKCRSILLIGWMV